MGKSSGNDLYLKQVQIYGHYVSFERYYLYDHGVELEPIATDGTKKNDCITLTVTNQTAVDTLDTTDYTAMGGYVGKNASGTNQLICGSSTSNFSLANLPDGNAIDISSVNGTNSVGVKQTANGTFDIEEIWLSSN